MTKTALVSGGAGYVGSHATQALLDAGWRVVVADNLSLGHRQAVPKQAHFCHVDLADFDALPKLFEAHRFDAVLHFAARSLVGESMQQPLDYLVDNVRQGHNLFRCVVQHEVPKLVLSSTANLYGEPDAVPIDEQAVVRPSSPYGESKLTLERSLRWLGDIHGLRWATLRYFNAAGADFEVRRGEDHRPETHLIPLVLMTALGKRERITVFGDDYPTPDGTCVRDYVHVVDLADAHVRALSALDEHPALVVNLGSGRGASVRQVLDTAREVTGRDIQSAMGKRRPGDPASLIASHARAHRLLGWQPRFSDLRTIVESAWRWHHKYPDGY